jgi:hypothetical protein
MDSCIKFLTRVYISFSAPQHDVTHHPAYQPEFLRSRTVSTKCNVIINTKKCSEFELVGKDNT